MSMLLNASFVGRSVPRAAKAVMNRRSFRVPDNSRQDKPDFICFDLPKGEELKAIRLVSSRLRNEMGLTDMNAQKKEVLESYRNLTEAHKNSVYRWVKGDAALGVMGWARESVSSDPFVVDPSVHFPGSKGTISDYNEFQEAFGLLPAFPSVMVRELEDASLNNETRVFANLKASITYVLNVVNGRDEPFKQPIEAYYYRPEGLRSKITTSLATTSKITLPVSAHTLNDKYRHSGESKIHFIAVGEGVPIFDVVRTDIGQRLGIYYNVQDEVVNREADYTVSTVVSLKDDVCVVLENMPGEIARRLNKGDTVEASRACVRELFSKSSEDVLNQTAEVMDWKFEEFFISSHFLCG